MAWLRSWFNGEPSSYTGSVSDSLDTHRAFRGTYGLMVPLGGPTVGKGMKLGQSKGRRGVDEPDNAQRNKKKDRG